MDWFRKCNHTKQMERGVLISSKRGSDLLFKRVIYSDNRCPINR